MSQPPSRPVPEGLLPPAPADELASLRLELQALRLANGALEFELMAGAEQADAMLARLEQQRAALQSARDREQSLAAFSERVMDTVGSVVIVLDAHGRLRRSNSRAREVLRPLAEGDSVDLLLYPEDQMRLAGELPPLPWPVHSVLFELVRRRGHYRAEHRLALRGGGYRHHLIEAVLLHSAQGKEEGAVITGADIGPLKQQEAELLASDARFRDAESVAHLGSWELDPVDERMKWSAETRHLLHASPDTEPTLAALFSAIHPEDRLSSARAFMEALAERRSCDLEFRIDTRDGPLRWVHLRASLQALPGRGLRGVGTVQDITERRQIEDQLRLAATVFDASLNAVLIADGEGRIRKINRAFTAILGYEEADVLGRNPSMMQSGHHALSFYQDLWGQLLESGHWEGEVLNRHRDGRIVPIWESITAVRDEQGAVSHFIGIFSDISEQKAQARRIHQLAYYDALTGLPNRTLLMDRCRQALSRAKRGHSQLAMLFMDLDRFKHINDSLGHPVGDALLQAVAQRLEQVVRDTDTVARLGGDEFVVLLENVASPQDVDVSVQRILQAFREPFALEEHSLSVGTTVGVSLYPEHGSDVTSLFKFADLALYQAKESSRGGYRLFEPRFNELALDRMRLESDLRRALERQEFQLHYQPVFTLADRQLVGAEALLRWTHPERGPVSPAEFIPVAEDSGLIIPIGAWVLEEACRQARAWLDQGLAIGVIAVNVAGLQIQRGDLAETVAAVLARTGLPAERLELEISESYIMRHAERDLRQLARLRELGVALAIDDFGTGQTSLSHLWHLPLSKLKVDRAFIKDLERDAAGATVTRAVIGLGHGLGFVVQAEGVETEGQAAFLKAHGCDLVQGFGFARPMPAADFARRCAEATRGNPGCIAEKPGSHGSG